MWPVYLILKFISDQSAEQRITRSTQAEDTAPSDADKFNRRETAATQQPASYRELDMEPLRKQDHNTTLLGEPAIHW